MSSRKEITSSNSSKTMMISINQETLDNSRINTHKETLKTLISYNKVQKYKLTKARANNSSQGH